MDDLNEMKRRSGLSNQQIADLSGVPIATVQRIMAGTCKNPGYENVAAIQDVLEQHVRTRDCQSPVDGFATLADITRLDAQCRETIERIEAQFATALASKDEQFQHERDANAAYMKAADRWLVRLGIACSVLMLFIMTALIIDMANPNIGWIRSVYLKDALSELWGNFAAALYLFFTA